jgi:mono/diheme cytochrome c family protein
VEHVTRTPAVVAVIVMLMGTGFARGEEWAERAGLILKQNCQSCHNPEKHKGGLDLTERGAALKGGDEGVAIVPGKSAESRLIAVLAADADPHMPPKGQLTGEEIDVLRRWIDGGMTWVEVPAQLPATRPVVLRGMPEGYRPVLAIALSPDGKRLAIGRGDRAVVVDATAKETTVVAECVQPNEPVYSLAWNHDGTLLAVGGYRHVRLWDLKSSGPVRTFDGLAGRVTALTLMADGRALLAADGEPGAEGVVREWVLAEPSSSVSWMAHRDSITSLKISADGTRVVTAGADKLVKVWDRAARKELAALEGHAAPVMAVALNADGTRVASAGSDKEIKVWDVKTRELVTTLTSSPSGVSDLVWLDEKKVLSASEDGVVRQTSLENKERAERSFNGAGDVVYCLALAADKKTVYAGCHDGKVYVWKLENAKLERSIDLATTGK